MFKTISTACVLFLSALTANAQQIGDCESSLVRHILSDVSQDAFVSYANGAIRVADIYVDGNLASNVVVVVLHPRRSDLHGAEFHEACTVVYSTRTRSPYFGQVYLRRATAGYDADAGLILTIPVRYFYTDRNIEEGQLILTINQALGEVNPLEQ